ncbi:MAG: alpha/beta hydrolase [Pseudomonadota bacterium]
MAALVATGAWADPEIRDTPAISALSSPDAPLSPALEMDAIRLERGVIEVDIADAGAHRLEVLWGYPRGAAAGDNRPAIVITHGNPRRSTHRKLRIHRYGWLVSEFARRGYVAIAVARRGFGLSNGVYDEWYGSCEEASTEGYVRAGSVAAEDLRAVLAHLAEDPRVDPTRLMASGVSGGGFASLVLAGDPPPGLVGAINFSGGRGSVRDRENCNAEGLTGAFHSVGHAGARPSLWLYARTDSFFWPELVDAHFDGTKAPARLVMFDRALNTGEGHWLMQRGNTALWRPAIDTFLRDIGMPTWDPAPPIEVDLGVAPPDGLAEAATTQWVAYLGSEDFRAFAVGEDGAWGYASAYRTADLARDAAMEACAEKGPGCRIVAEGDRLP